VKLSLSGLSVCIAMPVHRDIPPETVASLMATQHALHERGITYDVTFGVGSSVVTSARNKAVHLFLQTTCNRLFWIDSDMVWKAEHFIRLLALSQVLECVNAAYRLKRDPSPFIVDTGGPIKTNEYGCLPNVGTGIGFCCVQRSVVEALAEKAPKLIYPDVAVPVARIFRESERDGHFVGEDIAFYEDMRSLGFNTYLDPTVWLGHVGQKVFAGTLADQLERA
jgi:hypothetical protein